MTDRTKDIVYAVLVLVGLLIAAAALITLPDGSEPQPLFR